MSLDSSEVHKNNALKKKKRGFFNTFTVPIANPNQRGLKRYSLSTNFSA